MNLKGLISLAFGTLSLGISEYVAMGLLPFVAAAFAVSVAEAGHFIGAYALGVAVGAFAVILLRRLPLKVILVILICIHIAGNVLTVLAPDFTTLLTGRFIAGFPHGSFFGVGSIIAGRLAAAGRQTSAVSIMLMGITIANVFGVPLGTFLAHSLSFRTIFVLTSIWGLIVLFSCVRWIPDQGRLQDDGLKGQFAFLKSRPAQLVLAATFFGNAGIFCLISYVSPVLTDFAGLELTTVPAVMIAVGLSMVICNFISGRLCDRFTPGRTAALWQALAVLILLSAALFGRGNAPLTIVLTCAAGGMLFAISAPEQVSILRCAPGGLLAAGSSIQASFNLANFCGAFAGSIPFMLQLDLSWVMYIGALLTLPGVYCLIRYAVKYEPALS